MAETDAETLPADVVDAAERLTRLAREAVDDDEREAYLADRDRRLADHGYAARVREADDTLVLHPAEWTEDGTVRLDRVDDTDRAAEVSLSGPGGDDWATVEAHNAELVAAVADEAGSAHAANARAFADFMGNHYLRRVETATSEEVTEFLTEYFPRNAWPSETEAETVEESLGILFATAETDPPASIGASR
jgi:hypothetical protein